MIRALRLALTTIVLPHAVFAAEKSPTFNRDIAPIVFEHCVLCHHPGAIGPFPLTTFREVKKHADQIVRVTGRRYMPPWLPEPGHGDFIGERRLTDEQIAMLARWVKAGGSEGAASDLKVKPQWNDDWQLGPPNLVVTMPDAYTLPADGPDVYRNFVVPTGLTADRYVVAAEMRPGNPRAVHHAFLFVDPSDSSRRLAAQESAPGFPGMKAGRNAKMPIGHFASWQPGKMPERSPPDMAWTLTAGSDLVLQLHMRPSGKPEKIQASAGLYFTDHPPTRIPFVLCLRSLAIDIPAGAKDYAVENAYTLPVEGEMLGVLPHLHYLGKEVHGWADLPDGTTRELILIKQWDFNWQGDYRYAQPVPLPKGTTVHMRYTFDNSEANARNPNHPSQRVRYGVQSSDEMAELWLQFLPTREADRSVLERDFLVKAGQPDELARTRAMLDRDPKDAASRADLAAILAVTGHIDDAQREARQALRDDPKLERAYLLLGSIASRQNDLPGAKAAFKSALELDPNDAEAHNNLGYLLLVEGWLTDAIEHFEATLRLNPKDDLARQNLEKARAAQRERRSP